MKKVPPELDRLTDAILSYHPKPKTKAAKRRARRKKREGKRDALAVPLVTA
jgi:hypothetical protein